MCTGFFSGRYKWFRIRQWGRIYNFMHTLKTLELYVFKRVNFIICELYMYLNKTKQESIACLFEMNNCKRTGTVQDGGRNCAGQEVGPAPALCRTAGSGARGAPPAAPDSGSPGGPRPYGCPSEGSAHPLPV